LCFGGSRNKFLRFHAEIVEKKMRILTKGLNLWPKQKKYETDIHEITAIHRRFDVLFLWVHKPNYATCCAA